MNEKKRREGTHPASYPLALAFSTPVADTVDTPADNATEHKLDGSEREPVRRTVAIERLPLISSNELNEFAQRSQRSASGL